MASTFTLDSGRTVSYRLSATPAAGPVVLLSNSLLNNHRAWDLVVPTIEQLNFRVLRYDQPGHGASAAPSDPSTTTFESLADDARALLKGLNIDRLHAWVGVSLGAATGAVFAAKYPGVTHKLVLCDTISSSPAIAGVPDVFGPRAEIARKEGNVNSLVEQTLERWLAEEWRAANPEETERLRGVMRDTSVDGFVACINALTSDTFNLPAIAPKIAEGADEVVMVVGERDANLPQTMTELRDAMKSDKTIDVKIVKNAGHVCFIDGREQFCEILKEVL